MLLIQPIYMGMLFLSGATIPIAVLPVLAADRDAVHPGDLSRHRDRRHPAAGESVAHNWRSVWRSMITAFVGMFIATKLFRWEKEEKLGPRPSFGSWSSSSPFFLFGAYQAWSRQDLAKAKILARDIRRGRTLLIQNARIFVGDGRVIESGAILVRRERSRKSTKARRRMRRA